MSKIPTKLLYVIILGCCFYFPFLGEVHLFDWDEINFAESAREMILTGNYSRVQIDFKPFYEKPPLFFWMQTVAMHLFGINEFAVRFPNALMGVITLVILFLIGKKLKDERFGFIWALAYLGAFTPHLYFKSGIIDPTFNLFIFLGIYFVFKAKNYAEKSLLNIMFSGVFIGLAILTKGPVAGLLWGLTVLFYFGYARFKQFLNWREILVFGISCLLIASIWFANELIKNGFWFLDEFITYQIRLFSTPDAGHGQPFYYHFLVVLIGCFPISIFAIRTLMLVKTPTKAETPTKADNSDNDSTALDTFSVWMKIIFWVVMILFSIVTTKIVHYSSMAYFPVSFLATKFLYDWLNDKVLWSKWTSFGLLFIGFILSFLLAAVPYVGMNTKTIVPYIKDPFAVKNLEAVVDWHFYDMFIGIIYFGIIVFVVWFLIKRNKKLAIYTLSIATAVCLFLFGAMVVPKIERYTQGAAIDFYKSKQGQDVYVHPLGFKSYAHLFYFQKPISLIAAQKGGAYEDWLLNGKVDKPVFFVTKFDRYDDYKNHPNLEFIREENGFIFLKRKGIL